MPDFSMVIAARAYSGATEIAILGLIILIILWKRGNGRGGGDDDSGYV
jgi:Na+/proline symporter